MKVLLSLLLTAFVVAADSVSAKEKKLEKKLEKASDFREVLSSGETTVESGDESGDEGVDSNATQSPQLKENEELLSGQVRVMRRIDKTEVFFKDLKDSYIIPSGAAYGSLYKAFEQSQKKGTSVHFKADAKTRQILSLENAPAIGGGGAGTGIGGGTKTGAGSQ